jgi:hypothetical protein
MTDTTAPVFDYGSYITLGGAERMRYLADIADQTTVESTAAVMNFFKDAAEKTSSDDIMLLAVAFRVALVKVGQQAMTMPKDEGEAYRRLCFEAATVYSTWMTEHNFR